MTNGALSSTITGFISNPNPSNEYFNKMYILFDDKLNVLRSNWIEEDFFRIYGLQAGLYNLRICLPLGTYKDVTVELGENENKSCGIELGSDYQPLSSQNIFGPNYSILNYIISARLFSFVDGKWSETLVPNIQGQFIDEEGKLFKVDVDRGMHIIQLEGPEFIPISICVPPATDVSLLVRRSRGPAEMVHPIEAQFLIRDAKAQSLLTLLNRSAINEAKELTSPDDAERMLSENSIAEQFLYEKKKNPAVAAIGGYYLLKVRDYERLHDWPVNLANWFSWMPDGCIIRAWQLISQKKGDENILEIKQLLLESVKRGIPIYTEGLRLLQDGLTLLYYHFKRDDIRIEIAIQKVLRSTSIVDWSKETTTLIGNNPVDSSSNNNGGIKRPSTNPPSRPVKGRRKPKRNSKSLQRKKTGKFNKKAHPSNDI